MELKIALLPGDGIGPEIVGEAVKVLDRVAAKYGHVFKYEKALVGACAIDATGDPYPAETHAVCLRSDAVLFGAIGDPKYDNDPSAKVRPEQGLLRMRKSLGLYANLRPLAVFDSLAGRSPLKTEIVRGADFLCVRELTGGMYFGRPQGRSEDGNTAYDTCVYTREEIERILRLAFELARKRRKHLTVVDKANVIATSRLWRQIAGEMAPRYADVQLEFMFVDNAAMQIIQRPTHFDVIVTENLFGDILTDASSPRLRSARRWRCSSRFTEAILRPRARTSPIRWRRSFRPPCCSSTWGSKRRERPSARRSTGRSSRAS